VLLYIALLKRAQKTLAAASFTDITASELGHAFLSNVEDGLELRKYRKLLVSQSCR
jgi:hypothetical protein